MLGKVFGEAAHHGTDWRQSVRNSHLTRTSEQGPLAWEDLTPLFPNLSKQQSPGNRRSANRVFPEALIAKGFDDSGGTALSRLANF